MGIQAWSLLSNLKARAGLHCAWLSSACESNSGLGVIETNKRVWEATTLGEATVVQTGGE